MNTNNVCYERKEITKFPLNCLFHKNTTKNNEQFNDRLPSLVEYKVKTNTEFMIPRCGETIIFYGMKYSHKKNLKDTKLNFMLGHTIFWSIPFEIILGTSKIIEGNDYSIIKFNKKLLFNENNNELPILALQYHKILLELSNNNKNQLEK